MSSKHFAIASLVISILSLIALFYGAWLFDNHLITNRAEIFMLPAWGGIASVVFLIIGAIQH